MGRPAASLRTDGKNEFARHTIGTASAKRLDLNSINSQCIPKRLRTSGQAAFFARHERQASRLTARQICRFGSSRFPPNRLEDGEEILSVGERIPGRRRKTNLHLLLRKGQQHLNQDCLLVGR